MGARIVAFAGSARAASLNKRLPQLATVRVAEFGGESSFVDLADYRMPLYDGDLEDAEWVPVAAHALADVIRPADGLVIVSPEYNGAYPALLKNTIDWLSRVERGLLVHPTAILSATPGPGRGARVLPILRASLSNMRVPVLERDLGVGRAREALKHEEDRTALIRELDTLMGELLEAADDADSQAHAG